MWGFPWVSAGFPKGFRRFPSFSASFLGFRRVSRFPEGFLTFCEDFARSFQSFCVFPRFLHGFLQVSAGFRRFHAGFSICGRFCKVFCGFPSVSCRFVCGHTNFCRKPRPQLYFIKPGCISPQLAWKHMQLPIATFCVPKNKLEKTFQKRLR